MQALLKNLSVRMQVLLPVLATALAGISQSAAASSELSLLAEKQKEQLSFFKI